MTKSEYSEDLKSDHSKSRLCEVLISNGGALALAIEPTIQKVHDQTPLSDHSKSVLV